MDKELELDIKNIQRIKSQIEERSAALEKRLEAVRELEQRKESYDNLVGQSQEAYQKITENCHLLITGINDYCDNLQNKFL